MFWNTYRSFPPGPTGGGNFFIASYGIRIQGAANSVVAWKTKDWHGTTLPIKGPTCLNGNLRQSGLGISTPAKLPKLWKKYVEGEITINDAESEFQDILKQGEVFG